MITQIVAALFLLLDQSGQQKAETRDYMAACKLNQQMVRKYRWTCQQQTDSRTDRLTDRQLDRQSETSNHDDDRRPDFGCLVGSVAIAIHAMSIK